MPLSQARKLSNNSNYRLPRLHHISDLIDRTVALQVTETRVSNIDWPFVMQMTKNTIARSLSSRVHPNTTEETAKHSVEQKLKHGTRPVLHLYGDVHKLAYIKEWGGGSEKCTAVQPLHRRQSGFSSIHRQLLEQSSVTRELRDVCAVARDI